MKLYLATGCFWKTQHYYQNKTFISNTIVGYAQSETGEFKHTNLHTGVENMVECLEVEFETSDINQVLDIYFSFVNLNKKKVAKYSKRTEYRNGIYYTDNKNIIINYLNVNKIDLNTIEIERLMNFKQADERNQNYTLKHPNTYCGL